MRLFASVLFGFLLTIASELIVADENPSFPAIYNSQPETIPLLPPAEALKRIELPEGFVATLFASEPEVNQPIALSFDSRGRLWVAENYTYAESALNYDTNLRDRILIFEDTDGDGIHDKRTVFWDQAQKLTSVAVGFGGVFATCPPQLLFIPDKNRDDIPDGPPEVLLDGFDHDRIRHTLANGLKFGPDGWLYGRHGIQGTSFVGKPGTSQDERVAVNGSIWRYHPTRKIFELVVQGTTNPWGSDWDQHGELFFINTVIGHLWHAVPGAYFKRMYGQPFNPFVYEEIDQVADHFHWDTREVWSDINKGISSSTLRAGGGHAHTGLMFYLGDNWPDPYRHQLFTLNFHGKRINTDILSRHGATYMARHGPDFMSIDDPYFRGIDLASGPEGAVYIADWSDIGECHDNNGVHRTSGRIYRIAYGEPRRAVIGDLAAMPNLDLVRLLLHRNEWIVRQARQILQERAVRGENVGDAQAELDQMVRSVNDPVAKLRALWALYGSGGAETGLLRDLLSDSNEHVRVWAIRLLLDKELSSREVLQKFEQMAAADSSGLVLTYLASALQKLPLEERWPIARALVTRGEFERDRVLPLMVWYGIEAAIPTSAKDTVALIEKSRFSKIRALATRRVFEDLEQQGPAAEGILQLLALDQLDSRSDVLRAINQALERAQNPKPPAIWTRVAPKLIASSDPVIRFTALELDVLFGGSRSEAPLLGILGDRSADTFLRRQALKTLLKRRPPALRAKLHELLEDDVMAPDAVRALGATAPAEAAQLLMARLPQFNPDTRREAVNVLVSHPASALALVQAVQRGQVARKEIGASHLRQMRGYNDESLKERITRTWPESGGSADSRAALFSRYRKLLSRENLNKADRSRGRSLYELSCAPCHKLYGEGTTIGPELTGADRQDLDYLLENILNPSAVVPDAYRVSVVNLKDDRVLNGIVLSNDDQTLSLQTLAEQVNLPHAEIESVHQSELSMMPDGIIEALTDEQVADLFAYLMSTSP